MDQSKFMRLVATIMGIETWIKFKGKFMLTRIAKPKLLRSIAKEFTGKTYPASPKGLQSALDDLKAIKEEVIAKQAIKA